MLGDSNFKDCLIGFACNALDIQSGEEVVFTKGLLAEAVWASCAIPGIFPPYVQGKRLLVDGGVIDSIPVEPLRSIGARDVLAVYLSQRPKYQGDPNTGFQINQRSYSFMKYHLDQRLLDRADLVVMPDVHGFHWADFNSVDELVERGRKAALKNIDAIKSITGFRYRVKKIFRKHFPIR
jgi:NTE family protein